MVKYLEKGVQIDGEITAPCKAQILKQEKNIAVIQISIHEGRKRQIRRMLKEAGYNTLELERVEYAGIKKDIKLGSFRELGSLEIKRLYDLVGLIHGS
ncbi:MAG: hypothetical protein V2A72_08890 [Candidatus Omnitrophota bacterium]